MSDLNVLELFGGIGACSSALRRLGIDFNVVDYVDIDKYAVASYNAINNTNFEPQDITKWDKNINVDFIMHGSPCQDFSVAGKQAGGDRDSGTRSSLMYETIRIVDKLKPKYVVWENVKNLLSKKHKHNFDAYIETMDLLGYNSYYQVLNAKDYGTPQNRERVFTISIRKDIDKGNFKFPEKEELKLRLKDMLEEYVDEKYYLSNVQINRIKTTTYNVGKTRIQEKEYCDTLCARDWKDPKCVQVGTLDIKGIDQIKRVYSNEGISPTLTDMQGGNRQPKIVVDSDIDNPLKDKTDYGWHFEQNVYSDNSKCCRSVKAGGGSGNIPKIITHDIPQIVKVRKYPVDIEKLKETLRDAKIQSDLTNSRLAFELEVPITTVEHWFRKDNCFAIPDSEIWYALKSLLNITTTEFDESIMTFEEKEGVYDKSNRVYDENGLAPTLTQQEEKILTNISQDDLPIIVASRGRNPENPSSRISGEHTEQRLEPNTRGISNCLTSVQKDNLVLEQDVSSLIKENNRNARHQQDLLQGSDGVCRVIPAGTHASTPHLLKTVVDINPIKIRKLTPKECWRLMNFTDEEFEKAAKINSNSQLYKQAGNSIVVGVLERIFRNLFKED